MKEQWDWTSYILVSGPLVISQRVIMLFYGPKQKFQEQSSRFTLIDTKKTNKQTKTLLEPEAGRNLKLGSFGEVVSMADIPAANRSSRNSNEDF